MRKNHVRRPGPLRLIVRDYASLDFDSFGWVFDYAEGKFRTDAVLAFGKFVGEFVDELTDAVRESARPTTLQVSIAIFDVVIDLCVRFSKQRIDSNF